MIKVFGHSFPFYVNSSHLFSFLLYIYILNEPFDCGLLLNILLFYFHLKQSKGNKSGILSIWQVALVQFNLYPLSLIESVAAELELLVTNCSF